MTRALAGRRLLVSRDPASAAQWTAALEAHGAIVDARAVLTFEPAGDRESVRALATSDWLVFASANGVRFFTAACREERLDAPPTLRVAAIGPATAAAAVGAGWSVDYTSTGEDGAGFGADLARRIGTDDRALVVRPEAGRPELAKALLAAGVDVSEVVVYRAVPAPGLEAIAVDVRNGVYDGIVFTSPLTFATFVACETAVPGLGERLGCLVRVAIGPTTAGAMELAGMPPTSVAVRPDASGIVAAVDEALRR